MAKNAGNHRDGSVTARTQVRTPSGHYAKRNADTGRFMDVKTTDKTPFKGVAKEEDGRRK